MPAEPTTTITVGFAGLGRMGSAMACHLVAAGFDVIGFDPSPDAGHRLEARGGRVATSLDELARTTIVMSSLPDTAAMLDVYESLIPRLPTGSLCIDLSTVSVDAARRVSDLASERSVDFVDAPVSGTSTHAAAGTLVIMVGGSAGAFERSRPLLTPFASHVHHCGGPGMGLEMKLITNRLLTAHLAAIAEAILEIEDAGLDVPASLSLLRSGAVPRLLEYKADPMSRRDYTPLFTVDLMNKDLRLADERRPSGDVTAAGAAIMQAASAKGFGAADIAAIIEVAGR